MKSFLFCLAIALLLVSCSKSDDPPKTDDPINANLFDAELEAGYHCICWDQKYATNPAADGDYFLRMVAGTYDYSMNFTIKQGTKRREASECCDTATISIFPLDKVAKDPPEFFAFSIDTTAFARGDTIHIEVAVPERARVQLEISPRTGD